MPNLEARCLKVKVKCTLVQALMLCTGRTVHSGSRGIALPIHDHGTRRGCGVSVKPRVLIKIGDISWPFELLPFTHTVDSAPTSRLWLSPWVPYSPTKWNTSWRHIWVGFNMRQGNIYDSLVLVCWCDQLKCIVKLLWCWLVTRSLFLLLQRPE